MNSRVIFMTKKQVIRFSCVLNGKPMDAERLK